MDQDGFFLTIAQVGVALAGFSALISAFRRSVQPLTATEIAGRSMILETGLASTFFGLLPFPIDAALTLFDLTGVWRLSSTLLVIFLILWGLHNFRRLKRVSQQDNQPANVEPVFQILLIVVNSFLIVNIVIYGSVAFYMIGTLWLSVIASWQFLLFVYAYARQL
jgi:hypothetical protein